MQATTLGDLVTHVRKNNAGPRTEEGKAISSQNAVKHGLFSSHPFMRPEHEPQYLALQDRVESELCPVGMIEATLVGEIVGIMWRLARCRVVEGSLAVPDENGIIPDPMQKEASSRQQDSVDRARAQALRQLHNCTTELRRLQTDRQYLNECVSAGTDVASLGLADFRSIMKGLDELTLGTLHRHKLEGTDNVVSILERQFSQMARPIQPPPPTEMAPHTTDAKRTRPETPSETPSTIQVGRNAPCPCGSGQKHKRCCGKDAPPILQAA